MIRSFTHLVTRPECRSHDAGQKMDLVTRFIRWRKRRNDMEVMLRLPDYLLKDIGISRAEIENAARGRFEGKH